MTMPKKARRVFVAMVVRVIVGDVNSCKALRIIMVK